MELTKEILEKAKGRNVILVKKDGYKKFGICSGFDFERKILFLRFIDGSENFIEFDGIEDIKINNGSGR